MITSISSTIRDPFVLKVVEVAPPEPPKLFDLVRHVLGYADLPPIIPVLERIELKNSARNIRAGFPGSLSLGRAR